MAKETAILMARYFFKCDEVNLAGIRSFIYPRPEFREKKCPMNGVAYMRVRTRRQFFRYILPPRYPTHFDVRQHDVDFSSIFRRFL